MANYAQHVSVRTTPQTQPIPNTPMVKNDAGGFVFAVDDWTKLDRWLLIGAENGCYYASEQKMTKDNTTAVLACLKADGQRVVRRIVEISEAGRAPKNDPAIFALALALSFGDAGTKQAAGAALPRVCRIGTHLFQFVEAVQNLRGWGPSLRRPLRHWYTGKDTESLARQLTKYQQRGGFAHRDVLRLCHAKATGLTNDVLHWAVKGWESVGEVPHPQKAILPIWAFERAKRAETGIEVSRLIRNYDLPRECVPTKFLTDVSVWDALLEKMPMGAMVRNLATMTRVGLLSPMSAAVGHVLKQLVDAERIKKSRLHPIAILSALKTYASGHGERGQNVWTPVQQVVDALDGAFYKAFAAVEPTGKRWLLGLDVSGSMSRTQAVGMPHMTAVQAESAMALVTAATEPQHCIVAFDTAIKPLSISPRQRLDDVCNTVNRLVNGGTDCVLPILYAMQHMIEVDVFVVYTDSQTWAGSCHPVQAIRAYRQHMGIGAKLVVVAMCANEVSLVGDDDAGFMNVAGFDVALPQVLAGFVS